MIFAAINWLSISINLLLVVFVIVCLLMALLILMQRPKQEGLGAAFGGGVTDQVFGARTTNVLQKGTVYLGSLFFIVSLTLSILIGKQTKDKSLLDKDKAVAEESADSKKKPVEEDIPKSLADELSPDVVPAPPAGETPTPPVDETPAPPADETLAPPAGDAPTPPADETPAPPVGETVTPPLAEPTPEAPAENTPDKPQ